MLLSENLGSVAFHSHFVLSVRMFPPPLLSLPLYQFIQLSVHLLSLPDAAPIFCRSCSSTPRWLLSSHLILWQLTFYTHVPVSQFCATHASWLVLCGHDRNDFWWSKADFCTSKGFFTQLLHQLQWQRCRDAINHPSTELWGNTRSAWRSKMINAGHQLKYIISTLKQLFSEIW